MVLMSLRRWIAEASKIPTNDQTGFIGLQLKPDASSGGASEDSTHKACIKRRKRHLEGEAKVEARAPQVKIETVLSVVVADGSGRPIGHTTIAAIPSAGTVLNLAGVGPVTVPSLKVQNGKVTAVSPPTATRASNGPHKSAAAPGEGTNNSSQTSTRSPSSSATRSAATTSRESKSAAPTTFKSSTRGSSSSSSSSSGGIVVDSSSSSSSSSSKTSTSAFGVGGVGPTSTGAAPAASTTALVDHPASTQNVPVLVGGIVGSVAGFALILALFLALLKWRERRRGVSELKSNPADTPHRPDTGRSDMAEYSAGAMGAAGAITAAGAGRGANASERSFQRVGGRKLESVLVSGGDGYGEPGSSRNVGNASFYRDSEGTYGPVSQTSSVYTGPRELDTIGTAVIPPVPERKNPGIFRSSPDDSNSPSPPMDLSSSPPDVVVTRQGPARNVVYTPGFSTPPQSPLPRGDNRSPAGRLRKDAVGRSHPSFDGSRDSRGSKFAEDIN